MTEFRKENLTQILEIKSLIDQMEHLVATIERMVPNESDWLNWRHRTLQRRLDDAKRDLKRLVDIAQEQVLDRRQDLPDAIFADDGLLRCRLDNVGLEVAPANEQPNDGVALFCWKCRKHFIVDFTAADRYIPGRRKATRRQ